MLNKKYDGYGENIAIYAKKMAVIIKAASKR